MGVTADMLGEPALFEHEGQTYKVSPWNFDVQAAFERYLEKCAYDAYEKSKKFLSPEESDKTLQGVIRDVTLGKYTFGTEEISQALKVPKHVEYLFFLCLKQHHREVNLDFVKKLSRSRYYEMIAVMNLANSDPNLRKPAEEGQAPPAEAAAQVATA